MGVNATFYLRRRRIVGRNVLSVPIDSILRVEGCGASSCYVVVSRRVPVSDYLVIPAFLTRGQEPAHDQETRQETRRHLVVGNRPFVITYIKYLAMKHGVPVRLNLGL